MSALDDGIAALRIGDKTKARSLLIGVVKAEPENERAWMFLYNACDNEREKKHCLDQILRINPQNEKARQLSVKKTIPKKAKRNPLLLGVAVLVSFLVVFCVIPGMVSAFRNLSQPSTTAGLVDRYMAEFGGNRDIYTKLTSLEDCQALQTEFDNAAQNNERYPAGSANAKMSLGYMKAADERMKALGCYTKPLEPVNTQAGSLNRLDPLPAASPTIIRRSKPTWTIEPTSTIPALILNTQNALSASGCACTGDLYNCNLNDFPGGHNEAQECFEHCKALGKGDIHQLDGENDNLACESLP